MYQEEYPLFTTKVLKNSMVAKGVYLLHLIKEFDFTPGQVIGLTTKTTLPARLYSIASSPKAKYLQVLFDVKHEGTLTPELSRLKAGDELFVTAPFGSFTDDESPSCWIATGTGIAPFYSMAQSGLNKNKLLIHGSRTIEGFFFSDFFLEKLSENYIRCCSACEGEGIFSGRLTQYLSSFDLPQNIQKYYLCGSAEMVVDVRDLLLSKGVDYNSIHSEIYF